MLTHRAWPSLALWGAMAVVAKAEASLQTLDAGRSGPGSGKDHDTTGPWIHPWNPRLFLHKGSTQRHDFKAQTHLQALLVHDNNLTLYNLTTAAAAAKSLQSCPTLCDPIDSSPPGSPVPGILQARILEWVAMSFSNAWKWKVKVKSLSRVRLLETPWTPRLLRPWDFPGKSTWQQMLPNPCDRMKDGAPELFLWVYCLLQATSAWSLQVLPSRDKISSWLGILSH